MKHKANKKYSFQEVCDLMCEGCKLRVPDASFAHGDKSVTHQHILNGKIIYCNARTWRKVFDEECN